MYLIFANSKKKKQDTILKNQFFQYYLADVRTLEVRTQICLLSILQSTKIDTSSSSVLISITSLLFQHETKCSSSFILVNLVSKQARYHCIIIGTSYYTLPQVNNERYQLSEAEFREKGNCTYSASGSK